MPCFRAFHVGMATQHGYYSTLGDYIRPDRKTWLAMQGDKHGPVEMSFDKMRERIRAARTAGDRAAIYIHPVLLDDATPFYEKLKDCVPADEQGRPAPYPWQGSDTVGRNWRASLASTCWRAHLLQRSEWILDLLRPDALGEKPWCPCAWHFRRTWKHQMALARQVGSGVGVANGWLEYTGLHGLSQSDRRA